MKVWLFILAVGFFTFLMRYLPMKSKFFQKNKFLTSAAFSMLPYAILAALIGPTFLPLMDIVNPALSAALIAGGLATLVVTYKFDSLMWGALAGYLLFITLNFFFHQPM